MKNILSILVAIVGVAAIVFGVMFIMQANTSRTTLANELKPVTLATLDSTYDQVKAGLIQASTALAAATDPAVKAATNEKVQDLGLQKAGLSAAKSSRGTIDFVQMSGYLTIVLGLGFVFSGWAIMKKS